MTAMAMKGDREQCLEAGMNDYLPKPIEPQKLFEIFNRYLLISEEEETEAQPHVTI
jgi:CheY-like chemotaxis protein